MTQIVTEPVVQLVRGHVHLLVLVGVQRVVAVVQGVVLVLAKGAALVVAAVAVEVLVKVAALVIAVMAVTMVVLVVQEDVVEHVKMVACGVQHNVY